FEGAALVSDLLHRVPVLPRERPLPAEPLSETARDRTFSRLGLEPRQRAQKTLLRESQLVLREMLIDLGEGRRELRIVERKIGPHPSDQGRVRTFASDD